MWCPVFARLQRRKKVADDEAAEHADQIGDDGQAGSIAAVAIMRGVTSF